MSGNSPTRVGVENAVYDVTTPGLQDLVLVEARGLQLPNMRTLCNVSIGA